MSESRLPGLTPEEFSAAITSLSSPDIVASPFGDLHFFDGVPRPETVDRAYDALDLMRGIDVFLNAVPGASLVAFRHGLRMAGITSPRAIGVKLSTSNEAGTTVRATDAMILTERMVDLLLCYGEMKGPVAG